MNTFFLTLAFVAAVAVMMQATSPGTADDQKQEEQGPAGLARGYVIVSGEHDGTPIPEERIRGSVVQFTGNRIVGTDKDRKEFFSCTYALDTSKTPWAINMKNSEPKHETAAGLIKKEGETVTLIYALPGGETPKDFKTKEKQNMFVLKALPEPPNKFTKE
ncbi:MAG TPA: TIGR03067 domain-containing protein [Gemmata sp.]